MNGKVRDAAKCNKNEFGNIAIGRKRLMLSELWKVAAKYGNWQENIVNSTKSKRSGKIWIVTLQNGVVTGNYCKWQKKIGGRQIMDNDRKI